jgi:hypothetical protein
MTPFGAPPKEWEPKSVAVKGGHSSFQRGNFDMKKARRNHQFAKFARLRRQLEISQNPSKPRRIRTRSARYAASLAEQLGLLTRPRRCTWCRCRQRLERHHWSYEEPLNVTFLCAECHELADRMAWGQESA